ncbi:MAG: ABC transporter substrate-binding protein [Anaerolineae bacterium]|nr:ABC transporter substrate-binding protein [Anaerolineae bacterium]
MRKMYLSLLLVLALLVTVAAPVYGEPTPRDTKLRVGMIPIMEMLVLHVADQAGYFEDEGLDVEIVAVSGPLERDQVMLAGELDAMLNDVIGVGLFNRDEIRIVAVALGRITYPDYPQFRILAAPGSDIATPDDLKGVEIGISENSIIHYISQRILEHAGLSVDDMVFRPEPNIPVRVQLLMEGQLEAACIPDPLAQALIEQGAILIADDTSLDNIEFSQSTLSFTAEYVEEHPDAIEGFLRAWMRAAEDINTDPEAYRDLWFEVTSVPDNIKETYVLPPFPLYQITDEAAWNDTMDWMLSLDMIEQAPSYDDSVDGSFIAAIAPDDEE